tara:strand:+ start:1152 stop:2186 length:1035 start_codon:yes stop_codon:yes gene_type:complete
MDYKNAGVDVEAGRDFVNHIKASVESTHRREVIGSLGGFGGCIRIPEGYSKPILVAGTDGVGTKLELAQSNNSHVGVGVDLVAMCVNDVITSGAKPLFFLDYIATGSLDPIALAEVVEGIAEGCRQSGCALLGGETAEMPGFYQKNKYDLAGFSVAVVEESELVDGHLIQQGDLIIGIESSGFHSNGYSLIRKVLSIPNLDKKEFSEGYRSKLLEDLLQPTSIYVQLVNSFLEAKFPIHGMAHITGGGLPENLPRCLPSGVQASIEPSSWEVPQIFKWFQEAGDIPEPDLWNTFNLGIGYCLVVPAECSQEAIKFCSEFGFQAWPIGRVEKSLNNGKELLGLPF